MPNIKMLNPFSEIAIANMRKYLRPPTWENIEDFMRQIGTHNKQHIELFYGMPRSTLSNVKCGQRQLPTEFWHIIYEKVVPTYGVGFLKEYEEKIIREMKIEKQVVKQQKQKENKPVVHERLAKLL